MGSELLRITCALAAVVLPLTFAWIVVQWQAASRKRRDKAADK